MAQPKPLPAIPATNAVPALTVDAKAHLHDIIQYSVTTRSLSATWVLPLVSALDQLAQWLVQTDFLQDIRTLKEIKRSNKVQDGSATKDSKAGTTRDASFSSDKTDDNAQRVRRLRLRLHKLLQGPAEGPKHVLLTVAAPPAAVTAQELEFQIIPASQGCSFEISRFHLPLFEDDNGTMLGEGGSIISGLEPLAEDNVQVIGGSFRLQGLATVNEHQKLIQVLEIGAYTILSLCLELTLLRDSGVQLEFSLEPVGPLPSQPAPVPRDRAKARPAKTKEGIWSYITKHSGNILSRARTISQGSSAQSMPSGADIERPQTPSLPPFSATVKGIKECESVLSTTPGVIFPPPLLLTELAEKEVAAGYSDLTAGQHVGLNSILGWSVDHQLSGPNSFLRHQCITTLHSQYVPKVANQPNEDDDGGQSTASWLPCVQRHWRTYRYYSKLPDEDQRLGELVMEQCENAVKQCSTENCKFQRQAHQLRWVTGRARIIAKIHADSSPTESVDMWVSCHECGASTPRLPMANGTWLLSFGKYLELLAYAPTLAKVIPPICEHTKSTSERETLLKHRFNLVRHYAFKSYVISFSTSPIEDVYEVRIPRVQITKHRALMAQKEGSTIRDNWQQMERDKLRLEITMWWKGVKEHMNQLEEILEDASGDNPLRKPLPPSPPHEQEISEDMPTPKAPPKDLPSVDGTTNEKAEHKSEAVSISSVSTCTLSTTAASSLTKLSSLRQGFNATEQALYAGLASTPTTSLNDVRRLFYSAAKAASNRLSAWEKKHLPGLEAHVHYREPEWWSPGHHALPGGSIIVKEDEWASIIAFTLSSSDYADELMDMCNPRPASSMGAVAGSIAPTTSAITFASAATTNSANTANTGNTVESAVSQATSIEVGPSPSLAAFVANMPVFSGSKPNSSDPDPDDEAQASSWHVPESLSPHISRRDSAKEGSNILSLRDVLRNTASTDATSLTSRFSNANAEPQSKPGSKVPPSAFGAVSTEMTSQQAQGSVKPPTPATIDMFEQIFLDVEGEEYTLVDSQQANTPSGTVKPSNVQPVAETDVSTPKPSMFLPPPAPPPKDWPTPSTSAGTTPSIEKTFAQASASDGDSVTGSSDATGDGAIMASTMGSLTSTIANAMRYVLNVGQAQHNKPLPNAPYRGFLAMESPDIDSKPHIRYECIVGKRLKFSCTVYYAKQFDSLRRRCGVDEVLIQSLKKTENWRAEGGKSKSNFWKTSDDRFIIKTLVDAWNVADLQVLIDLGPSYFRYMDKTTKKPSVMAKLLGFFTVELKNQATGAIQTKADLLIMENLFYERKISQTFDLKGIEGRKIKPSGKSAQNKTLFDGEWLEGQKKALILLHPHSKSVLEQGIAADADFLASSNIMDYSLLLGVDPEQKQIVCGLVDTIGSYTFAKTLEYKAKQNIKKEVTVIPPNEYRDRFVKAIDSYFAACPDKWSHPGPSFVFSSKLPDVL